MVGKNFSFSGRLDTGDFVLPCVLMSFLDSDIVASSVSLINFLDEFIVTFFLLVL